MSRKRRKWTTSVVEGVMSKDECGMRGGPQAL